MNGSELERQRMEGRVERNPVAARAIRRVEAGESGRGHGTRIVELGQTVRLLVNPVAICSPIKMMPIRCIRPPDPLLIALLVIHVAIE